MKYTSRKPRGRLTGLVELLWHIDDPASASAPQTICPDGRTEIVLHLGQPMQQYTANAAHLQPRHLIVGQMSAPVTIAATGRALMVGARLAPDALFRLLPLPQDRIAATIVDAGAVWHRWTARAADAIANAPSAAGQLDALETALEQLAPSGPASVAERTIRRAIRCLESSGGTAPVEALAHAAGVSRRHFERLFQERVGLSPRLFGRIVRFQQAFQALGSEPAASIAARCGYADQSHLVREVRRFAGQTPRALAEAEGLTAIFRSSGAIVGMSQKDKTTPLGSSSLQLMKATLRVICTVAFVVSGNLVDAQTRPQAADLAFLTGCWVFERGERTVEEHWLRPAGGSLMGVSRTVAGGKTTEFEFLQIRDTADGMAYIAKPSGQAEASFKLVTRSTDSVAFENPTHDFPQRISYQRSGDTLTARVEGTLNGKTRAIDLPYRRTACSP